MHYKVTSLWGMAIAVSMALSTGVWAQAPDTTTPKPQAHSQSEVNERQQGSGFQLDLGYRLFITPDGNSTYYRLKYQDNVLTQKGQPLQDSFVLQPPKPVAPPPADSYDFLARFERGTGKFDGPVFDVLKVKPLSVPALTDFRGVAQVFGKLSPSRIDTAVGLEYKSLPLLGRNTQFANYFIPGIQAATQSEDTSTGTSQSKDVGRFTYRSFIGTWLGSPVKSDQLGRLEDTLRLRFHDSAPDYATLRSNVYAKKLEAESSLNDRDKKFLWQRYLIALSSTPTVRMVSNDTAVSEVQVDDFIRQLRLNDPPNPAPANITDAVRNSLLDYMQAQVGGNVMPSSLAQDVQTIRSYQPQTGDTPPQNVIDAMKTLLSRFIGEGLFVDMTVAATKQWLAPLNVADDDPVRVAAELRTIRAVVAQPNLDAPSKRNIPRWEQMYANRLALEQAFPSIHGLSGRPADVAVWKGKLNQFLLDSFFLPDRSPASLWLEGSGQYIFSGGTGAKFTDIFAATVTYYLNPRADNRQWLRVRYENGRDQAEPDQYKNYVTFSGGFEF